MCGSYSKEETTKWQKHLPDSEGEWLWIDQWSCGCVHKSGIAWVEAVEIPENLTEEEKKEYDEHYKNRVRLPTPADGIPANDWYDKPNALFLSWEGSYYYEGQKVENMTAWQKIELPPREWCEER